MPDEGIVVAGDHSGWYIHHQGCVDQHRELHMRFLPLHCLLANHECLLYGWEKVRGSGPPKCQLHQGPEQKCGDELRQ